jgi:hypothetical protein
VREKHHCLGGARRRLQQALPIDVFPDRGIFVDKINSKISMVKFESFWKMVCFHKCVRTCVRIDEYALIMFASGPFSSTVDDVVDRSACKFTF